MNKRSNEQIEETVDEQLNNSGEPFSDRRVAPDADHQHTAWKEQQRNAHRKAKSNQHNANEEDEGENKDEEPTKTDQN